MEIYSTGKTQCFCSCSVAGDASALFCTKKYNPEEAWYLYGKKNKNKYTMWRKEMTVTSGRFKTALKFQFNSQNKYQQLWERFK